MISGPPAAVRMRAETSSQRWLFNRITRGKKTDLCHTVQYNASVASYAKAGSINCGRSFVVRGDVMILESLRYCTREY
jgi:hypothetical protein